MGPAYWPASEFLTNNMGWPFKDSSLMSRECIENLADCAAGSGVDPDIVHGSGPTKMEVRNR